MDLPAPNLSAAAAACAVGRGHPGVRRLPEGTAGNVAAAADECRDAVDLDLSVCEPRKFRTGFAGSAFDRRCKHRSSSLADALCRHAEGTGVVRTPRSGEARTMT